MDSYEGNVRDPLTLGKYLYASSSPVDAVDPSGNDPDLLSVMGAVGITLGLAWCPMSGPLLARRGMQLTFTYTATGKRQMRWAIWQAILTRTA